ncbi:MAG TPA: alpha/beta hydrolase-fold protein [Candidatus Dormibacteraeota bacterium]|nr:alpha/beta hydrolase-fold protein [Candidatus Dormibacteraeota bacterium]
MQSRPASDLRRLLALSGALLVEEIESPALRGNALGDPSRRLLPVYLPPGYDAEGSRRYPTLYGLHGFTGSAAALLGAKPWSQNPVQWLDRLIVEGRVPPAILVLVDGFTRYGGSQYVNSALNGNYADYAARDVVDYVDANFRTLAQPGGRGLFGKSSGGFGTLHLVMEYPGRFAAAASQSGDAYFTYCYLPDFVKAQRALERHGGLAGFVAAFDGEKKKGGASMDAMNIVGMTAAYSPKPDAKEPFDLEFPFDLKTGVLREDVWARWLQFDPAVACVERIAGFRALRSLYVDCGRRDQYALDLGARILVGRLREHNIEVRHEEFDDDHMNVLYRHEQVYPALLERLDHA